AQEPLAQRRPVGARAIGMEQLERHAAIQLGIVRRVDHAHGALAQAFDHDVAPERVASLPRPRALVALLGGQRRERPTRLALIEVRRGAAGLVGRERAVDPGGERVVAGTVHFLQAYAGGEEIGATVGSKPRLVRPREGTMARRLWGLWAAALCACGGGG